MADASWKSFERRVARIFGGKRRGPDFRGANGGKSDVIAEGWAVECKLLGRPTYGQMLAACKQAEGYATDGQIPVAIVKRKYRDDVDAIVCMRLDVFREWFIGQYEPPEETK